MVKKQSKFIFIFRNLFSALFDALSLGAALILGYWLWVMFPWHGNYQPFWDYVLLIFVLIPLGLWIFSSVGLYKSEVGILGIEEQCLILKGIWVLYTLSFAITFFYRDIAFSRLATLYSIVFAILFVSVERYSLRRLFSWLNQHGLGVRNAVIYGAGYQGQRLERWVRQSPKLGIKVIGYLDDEIQKLVKKPHRSLLGGFEDLGNVLKEKNVEILFITNRSLDEESVIGIFQKCRDLGLQCFVIPSLYQFHVEYAQLFNIGGIPLMGFRQGVTRGYYPVIKRGLDLVLGSFLLLLALPLMLMMAAAMKKASRQSVFFKQTRIGKDGKPFTMLKFRTLKSEGDAISPELKEEKAVFLPFGKFLRKSGLDELPQLFHVIKGEMSLIGPRPEMPFIVEKYGPLERERLTAKPGITGLWQISEDRKKLLIHENMDYDLYYIERLGFNLDLAILFHTGWTVLKRLFSAPARVFPTT